MPFDWKEYLLLSQEIYRSRDRIGHNEAIFRCVVSRAYYAAFCGSRYFAKIHQKYVPSNSAIDHIKIRDHFRNRGRNDVASKLEELKKWRTKCDYNDDVRNIEIMTKQAIKTAFEIFNHLDCMRPPTPRPPN
jgi:hypothetical protein